MRTSLIVLCCFLGGMVAQEASAAFKVKHFPPCPEGIVDKKTVRMPRLRIDPLSHLPAGTILPSQCLSRDVLVAECERDHRT